MTPPDVRAFYAALGIELPAWSKLEAPVRCFAQPDAHHPATARRHARSTSPQAPGTATDAAPTAAPTTPRSPPATRRARRWSC